MPLFMSRSPWLRAAFGALLAGVAFHAARALFGFGGPGLRRFSEKEVYTSVEFLAVAVCAARALTIRAGRAAWVLITAGLLAWTLGDLIWTVWFDGLANPPDPSIADACYLAMYPCLYAGLMLLMRSQRRHIGNAQWLDGAVVGLTAAAVGAALVFSSVLGSAQGDFAQVAVNLAYPLGDFGLLIFIAVGYALRGWRPDRRWAMLGAGIAVTALADIVYVYEVAKGTYAAGGLLDTLWPASMAILAAAAWQPSARVRTDIGRPRDTVALPAVAGVVAVGLLLVAAFDHVSGLAAALAGAAILVAGIRAGITYIENVAMLRRSAHEAVTDALTGLGNRRRMMECLADCVTEADAGHVSTLILFDLNGFKAYNDTFGHAAGDALLTRLAQALAASIRDEGQAFRLGGDEFCVLLEGRHGRGDRDVAAAASALSEVGTRFTVTAARGVVVLPDDATDASRALQLADERMYAHKASSGQTARGVTRDVLMQVLSEREPDLHEHVHTVGELVVAVAAEFALDGERLDEVLRAAELHDVGKLAIPDAILQKPGPLDDAEWGFMREHPVIGERILNTAPALRPVARLVRASHERWDGRGYPDGLAGTEIPLGARIIAACDAFEAMTSNRCYQSARVPEDAIEELRRNAGSQFDPDVIEAFCRIWSGLSAPAGSPWARAA